MKAAFLLTKLIVPEMVKQGKGSVVYVTSVGAYTPFHAIGSYCISKTALLGLTKTLAIELAQTGVRVNGIAPGIIKTKFSEYVSLISCLFLFSNETKVGFRYLFLVMEGWGPSVESCDENDTDEKVHRFIQSIDWTIDWLIGRLVDWSVDWLTSVHRMTGRKWVLPFMCIS